MLLAEEKQDCLDVLKATYLFEGAPELCAAALDGDSCVEVFEAGQAIYTQSEFRRCLGVVIEGRAKVLRRAAENRRMAMSVLSQGDVFGAAALYSKTDSYPVEIVALERCRALLISQRRLSELFTQSPVLVENYLGYLCGRIAFLNKKLDAFAAYPNGRLAAYLLDNAHFEGEAGVVKLECSYSELANNLNMGRASLYRALDTLEEARTIERNGRTINILKLEGLPLK